MSRVVVNQFAISLDGFGTGEGQTLDAPFGHAGERLHTWMFEATRRGAEILGVADDRPRHGLDDTLVSRGWDGSVGAEIMGRRKYWPYPGDWDDSDWKGWWGDNPPFHTPVFVLTHHPRPSIEMDGGTTFHFIDASPEEAVARAREAADGKDVRIGGGPSTVRDFIAAGLVDDLHLVIVPIVLGRGESLWEGLEGIESGFEIESVVSPTSGVIHQLWQRKVG